MVAIGAERSDILRMILGEGLTSAALGLIEGFLLSLVLMPLLGGLLFGVAAADPVNYILICALVLTVSALAAFLPARHAVGIDPTVALRHE